MRGLGPSDWCLAMAGVGFFQSWEKSRFGRAFCPTWIPIDSVCLRLASMECNVAGKYGPHGELFFFLMQKEPPIAPNSETFSPFINPAIRTPLFSADVLKKCALLAWHVMAEEGRDGDGFSSLRAGGRMGNGLPKESKGGEGEAWSEDESVSTASREGNVCNDALHVVGLHGSGDKISVFLQDWELAKVALSCHVALDMLCQEMREAW